MLNNLIAQYLSSRQLTLLLNHKAVQADVKDDMVYAVTIKDKLRNTLKQLKAPYFVDATELGDLLPLTGAEFVTGTESKKETGELHAPENGNPNNVQLLQPVLPWIM